jgi:hypothetical protein
MNPTLRPAEARDRPDFVRLLTVAAKLEAYEASAIDSLAGHAFGPEAFVKVVLAEQKDQIVGAMAYYLGFNDAGLSVNVVFLHVIEDRRSGPTFRKMIGHARRLAGERNAASLNLAGAIFDERVCGMLQSARRRPKPRAPIARAFSDEVASRFVEENATNKSSRAAFRFRRIGKRSRDD